MVLYWFGKACLRSYHSKSSSFFCFLFLYPEVQNSSSFFSAFLLFQEVSLEFLPILPPFDLWGIRGVFRRRKFSDSSCNSEHCPFSRFLFCLRQWCKVKDDLQSHCILSRVVLVMFFFLFSQPKNF